MPKTKSRKEDEITSLHTALNTAKSVVLVNYGALNVKDATALRFACQKEGVQYKVAKKTLLQKALTNAGLIVDESSLDGAVGIAVGDEVSPAKVLATFGKGRDTFKILGGFLEKKFIDSRGVALLATLPSAHELLATLVGTLHAPITGFVRVLQGNITGFVRVLGAINAKKGV